MRSRAALAFLAALAACRPSPASPPAETAAMGDQTPAPPFSLKDLNGKTVSLADFRGKPVFIDFWASWCPPCRASMPEVETMRQELADRGLVVLGLNLDEDPDAARKFVERKGVAYPTLLAGGTGTSDEYGVQGIPFFALVDQEGRLAQTWEGYSGKFPAEWRRAVERLLPAK